MGVVGIIIGRVVKALETEMSFTPATACKRNPAAIARLFYTEFEREVDRVFEWFRSFSFVPGTIPTVLPHVDEARSRQLVVHDRLQL